MDIVVLKQKWDFALQILLMIFLLLKKNINTNNVRWHVNLKFENSI